MRLFRPRPKLVVIEPYRPLSPGAQLAILGAVSLGLYLALVLFTWWLDGSAR